MVNLFSGAYVRTIQTLTIPEAITHPDRIRRPFRMKEMLEKLSKGHSPDSGLWDFGKIYPIFKFNESSPSGYKDEFWKMFWDSRSSNEASHFPFKTIMRVHPKRVGNVGGVNLLNQWANLKARLFPYGAISFHLTEYIKFDKKVESEKIIEYLELPIYWDSITWKPKQFWSELIKRIRQNIITKQENFPFESSRHIIVNPQYTNKPMKTAGKIEDTIDLTSSWDQVATLLAASTSPRLTSKHSIQNYKNLGDENDQFIFSSKYATVILSPPFKDHPYHGLRCLRNRISNFAELSMIQENFVTQNKNSFDNITNHLGDIQGYKVRQLKRYFKNKIQLDEILAIKRVIGFHQPITKDRWKMWYDTMVQNRQKSFQDFAKSVDELNKTNLKMGEDVRKSISNVIDEVKDVSEIAKNFVSVIAPSS